MSETNPRTLAIILLVTSALGLLGPMLPRVTTGFASINGMQGGGILSLALMGACLALAGVAVAQSKISKTSSIIILACAGLTFASFIIDMGKLLEVVKAQYLGVGFYLTGIGSALTVFAALLSFFVRPVRKSNVN